MQSVYSQDKDISSHVASRLRSREERLELLKRSREFNEFKECTFKPEVADRPLVSPRGQVKGTERFMELKDMARRQALEKRVREEKVFKLNVQCGSPQAHTVPQPFQLHTAKRAEASESKFSYEAIEHV